MTEQSSDRPRDVARSTRESHSRRVDVERSDYRIGAKAVVTAGQRVLLISERHAAGSVFWTLPGGRVESEETIPEGLRREIREELQCGCTVGRQFDSCVYDHRDLSATSVYAILRADLQSTPRPNPGEGVIDYAWRRPGNLPEATLPPIRDALERLDWTW